MSIVQTRRQLLVTLYSGFLAPAFFARAAATKPLRGAFPIMATPYTESKAIDYEDLAGEVDFMADCGVQGMVWPQSASEYTQLTKDERMKGMEVLAKAAKGKKPALILGVQGVNTEEMLEYARHAESLQPDAVIAIPPAQGKSLDDFRAYYTALCETAKRPVFIQTSSGPKNAPACICRVWRISDSRRMPRSAPSTPSRPAPSWVPSRASGMVVSTAPSSPPMSVTTPASQTSQPRTLGGRKSTSSGSYCSSIHQEYASITRSFAVSAGNRRYTDRNLGMTAADA